MERGNNLLATIYLCAFCFSGLDLDTRLFSHDTTMFDVIDIEMSICCRFGYIKSLNLKREMSTCCRFGYIKSLNLKREIQ
jgi:hypothetical protein